MREIDELTQVDDPAWPELQEAFAASAVPVRVLATEPAEARRSLLQLQVTARSTLGAPAWHCGGPVLDDGWVRVFGGGTRAGGGLPSLAQVNRFPAVPDRDWRPEAGLVVERRRNGRPASSVAAGHNCWTIAEWGGGQPARHGAPAVPGCRCCPR